MATVHPLHHMRTSQQSFISSCCAQQTGMHILVVEALLIAIYSAGDEQILIHKRKPCRSKTCLVRIAGPCPAVPVQLVPAQLGLSPAAPYQLWCTSLLIATDTRPTRNTYEMHPCETYAHEMHACEMHVYEL